MFRQRSAQRSAVLALVAILVIEALGAPGATLAQPAPTAVAPPAPAPIADPAGQGNDLVAPGILPPLPAPAGEVVARDAQSTTVANADGTLSTRYSIRPQHWRDASGAWREFDNGLATLAEADADFARANRTGPFAARFAPAAAVAAGRPLVELRSGELGIATTAIGAAPSDVSSEGAVVTYADAWPGADLRYTLDNERLKEEIILAAAPIVAPAFAFALSLDGLRAEAAPGGGLVFRDAAGGPRFAMPPLIMSDSAAEPALAKVSSELASDARGRTVITLAPDLAWLTDPARDYPVSIDPSLASIEVRPADDHAQNVHVDQASPTTSFYGAATMSVGKNGSGQRADALIAFPSLDDFPADSVVIDATLELEFPSGTDGMGLELRHIEDDWDDETVTWNTAPDLDDDVQDAGAAVVGGETGFDLTALVGEWIADTENNEGVVVRSTGANSQSVAVHSSWAACSACRPELEITYVPATRYGSNPLWTATSTAYGGGNSAAVEVSSGNLAFSHAGGAIDARGFSVHLTHTYNSADPIGIATGGGVGVYGEGWSFAPNLRLFEVGGVDAVVFKDGSGDESRVFVNAGTGGGIRTYSAPPRYGYTLTEDTSSPAPDQVWTLTSDVGNVEHFFDASGKLTGITDRNGNTLDFTYDGSDRLITITDVAARDTELEYNGSGGRLSQITDMAGRVHTYAYSGSGDLATITHADGSADEVTSTFAYDDAHRLIGVTNPRGDTAEIRYTAISRWESSGDLEDWRADNGDPVLSQSTAQAHSGTGSLKVELTDVGGTYESVERNNVDDVALSAVSHELLAWVYLPPGSSALQARLAIKYEDHQAVETNWQPLTAGAWVAVRMPAAQVDIRGQIDETELHFRRPSGAPNFSGSVFIDDFGLKGQVASQSDAAATPNTVVTYAYDPDGTETDVSRPNSAGAFQATNYEYDDLGAVTRVIDPLGNRTSYARDDLLRITSVTPPGLGAVPYTLAYYPNSMQLATATNGAGEVNRRGADTDSGDTRYSIDPLNEALSAGGTSAFDATVFTRDATGNVLAAITSRYAAGSDLEDDPSPAAQSEHRRVEFDYTTGGLLDVMTDPLGNETLFDYDIATGYLTEISAEPGDGEATRRVTTFSRNAHGSVDSMTDPAGQDTEFAYDTLGRLTDITYGVGEPDEFTVSYTLDEAGNLVAMDDDAGSTEWTYDANNRVITESRAQNALTKTAEYAYFANGTLQTLTTFAAQTVSFSYDNALRLTAQTDPNNGGHAISFGYDDRSRRTSITYPSGVSHTQTYDAGDRVASIILERGNGTDLQTFSYDYGFDGSGNRTADYAFGFVTGVSELDGSTVTYEYDELARLVAAERTGSGAFDQAYTYDAANNRTAFSEGSSTTTYSYDDAHQLVSDGTDTYDYDRNGNLTRAGSDDLAYDPANDWVDGDVNGVNLAYTYDGLGRQVSRTQGSSNRTDFWFDASGLSLESGQSNLTYLRDPGGLPLSITNAGTVRNYGRDRLGSITAIVGTGQSLQRTYTYDPYGEIVATTGNAANSLKFTGGRQDPGSTWYTLGQRTYAPELARFTTIDPLASSITDLNRYAYAGCNPANFIDPTGTSHCTTEGTVGVVLGTVTAYVGGGLSFAAFLAGIGPPGWTAAGALVGGLAAWAATYALVDCLHLNIFNLFE